MEKIKLRFTEAFCKSYVESVEKLNNLMKKLKENRMSPLERAIINELSGSFPFHKKEIERAYSQLRSFDGTINLLEQAQSGGFSVDHVLSLLNRFDEEFDKEPKQITEEIFLNKELCDAIRKLVTEHPFNLHQAILIMEGSKDYDRDVDIAGKLRDGGYDKNKIAGIIKLINR